MVVFTILGFATAGFLLYKFLTALWFILYPHIIAKILGHVIDVKSLGKWAVVTGATDGIGKGYAKTLAKRGVNVLLISRSEEKLKATADEIRKINSNVEIRTLTIDFKQATPEVYRTTIADALKNIEVGILINNVGVAYTCPEEFTKVNDGEEIFHNMVLVNSISAVQMTRLVLPSMLQRKKGAVITISSAAAFAPVPYYTVYSSTKIFLDYLVQGLSTEYVDSGVIFQIVNPFYVVTKMSGLAKTSFWAVDPDSYASNALDTVGILDETSGCLSHEIQRVGMKLFIGIIPTKMMNSRMLETMKLIQAKHLARQKRENKAK